MKLYKAEQQIIIDLAHGALLKYDPQTDEYSIQPEDQTWRVIPYAALVKITRYHRSQNERIEDLVFCASIDRKKTELAEMKRSSTFMPSLKLKGTIK